MGSDPSSDTGYLPMARLQVVLLLGLLLGLAGAWAPGIPTGWETAPSTVQEFPNSTADPWRYSHRLGLYKLLLASTTQLHFDNGWGNPLWGLPLQFSWQHDTARLDSSASDRVNSTSWWGNMNYVLSVVPFVAAVEAGLIADSAALKILPPAAGATIGCTSYSECLVLAPNATSKWLTFMQRAKEGGLNSSAAVLLLWDAHLHSLHEGTPLAAPLVQLLPSRNEAKFGLSWANLVDFVAAMQFDVDYNNTNTLQGLVMPPRILRDDDTVPHIADFSGAQNRALLASSLMYKANQDTSGRALQLFQRLCCTQAGRTAAYSAMVGFMKNPIEDVGTIVEMLWDLVKSHPC